MPSEKSFAFSNQGELRMNNALIKPSTPRAVTPKGQRKEPWRPTMTKGSVSPTNYRASGDYKKQPIKSSRRINRISN